MKRNQYTLVMSSVFALLSVACASRQSSVATPPPYPSPAEGHEAGDDGGSIGSHEAETESSASGPPEPSPLSPAEDGDPADGEPSRPGEPTSEPRGTTDQSSTPGSPGLGESTVPNPDEGTATSRPQVGSAAEGSSGATMPPVSPTAEEKAAKLDRQLDRTLEDFDGLLLDEQELLEEQAALRDGGGGLDSDRAGPPGGNGTGEGPSPADRQTGSDAGQPIGGPSGERNDGGAVGGSAAPGDGGDSADDRVPPDVGDGSDDDIIARQLREAATREEDPDLRQRLWEEYRAYKASLDSDEGGEG